MVVQENTARELDHEVLPVGPHVPNARADQAREDLRIERLAPAQLDTLDDTCRQRFLEPVRGAPDFGSFAHDDPSSKRRAESGSGARSLIRGR